MISFCVVDDHEVVHDGLRAMAGREGDLDFRGSASTVRSGEALVERERPDIVLVDLRIGGDGGGSGIELCRSITRRRPRPPVVVLFSAYGNRDLLSQAIDAGAAGYVLKETSVSRIPAILREVSTTGSWFEPRIANELLHRRLHAPETQTAFTDRELEIVRAVGRGRTNHEIGEQLHLSPHAVKYHVASMLRRHRCHRRAELVRLAHDRHLLD